MAKAKVQLRHCESFTGLSGIAWVKNQARTLTNEKQIAYYKGQPEFVVTMLQEPKPKRPAAPPAPTGNEGTGGDDGGGEGTDNPPELTEAKLKRMSNAELVDLAAERFELALDEDEMKKADLVAAILEAQG